MVDIGLMLLWAAITGGTPLVILVIPLARSRISDRVTHLMLGLSAGILLGISLFDILPESLDLVRGNPQGSRLVAIGTAAGFLGLLLVERTLLTRGGSQAHFEEGREIRPFGTLAMSALAVHGFVDGFVIPLGFEAGAAVGLVITLAIALHQIPDSFAGASVSIASLRSRRIVLGFVLATAIDTPIGIGVGSLFVTASAAWLPIGLAFCAGTFLFVSAADLIPELQHRARSLLVTASIFGGFVIVAALTLLLPA
ncbi:MAG: ZIP family metal transporter [Methanobacteriota archaeon]|nr:MAG: ZIP family metal transporter [Euryarchaeota archaeon]